MTYHAFISYRRDTGFLMAQVLRELLKDKGISSYVDIREDHPGKFDENLAGAIGETPNFILVLTKGSLDRCISEYDWVRREIIAAVRGSKNIIPVIAPDFTWPVHLNEQFPEELRSLETQQGVLLSQEYILASIDKIISYMKQVPVVQQLPRGDMIAGDVKSFFENGLTQLSPIVSVDMAFHAGTEWLSNQDKLDILEKMLEQGISLRILLNNEEVVGKIGKHMMQSLKRYSGFDNAVRDWIDIASQFPDRITVRVADVPILHRIYIIQGVSAGVVNIQDYSYGKYTAARDLHRCFVSPDPGFNMFRDEFNYLWHQASRDAEEAMNQSQD